MNKILQSSLFVVFAAAMILHFSSCDDEFNEFEFGNDVIVSGNLMFDGDSAIANEQVFLLLDYVWDPTMSGEFLDQVLLDIDTTDVNGFFEFIYKPNNKIVGADTCDGIYGEGLRMRVGNNEVFACFPSNRNLSDLEVYVNDEMDLDLTIVLGNVDTDTVFFNYAPLDTLHPNYIERFDSDGNKHSLFYALSSPNKTIIVSYETNLKNALYEGFSAQRRGIQATKFAVGFDAYLSAQNRSWRPQGKPFTDRLDISIN